MSQRRLHDLPSVLRKAGLHVVEVPGWRDLSRPESSGGFTPVGNLWHHTGSKDTNPLSIEDDYAYAVWLAKVGRSDLAAPLCQVSPARNGTLFVCAAGRGNHAGKAKASGPVPAGDGNELYIGWECQNNGSEGWTPAQYDAMVRGAAATSKHYGWSAEANRAHKETSVTGKWDPGLLDMAGFRDDIAEQMVSQDDLILEDLATARRALRLAKAHAKDPKRPKIVFQIDRSLDGAREARDIVKGS